MKTAPALSGPSSPAWFCQARLALFPMTTLKYWKKKYGTTFKVPMRSHKGYAVYLTNYSDVQKAFGVSGSYTARVNSEMSLKIFGKYSIFNSSETNGDHERQRKTFIRHVAGVDRDYQISLIVSVVDKYINSIDAQKLSLIPFMSEITLRVTAELVFGSKLSESEEIIVESVTKIVELIRETSYNLQLRSVKLPFLSLQIWKKIEEYRELILHEVKKMLVTQWSLGDDDPNLPYVFQIAKNAPQGLSGEDLARFLRDELITVIFAGMDTTALTSSFGLIHLFSDESLLSLFRDNTKGLSKREIFDNDYVQCFCQEVVRLYPTIVDLPRIVNRQLELSECSLSQNDVVFMMPFLSAGDSSVFNKPEQFDPDRFLSKSNHASELLGFSYGKRRCPGASLALLQMSYIITMLSRLRLRVRPKVPQRIKSGVFFTPSRKSSLALEV